MLNLNSNGDRLYKRANHYYAYGKTISNSYFEIASVIRKDEISSTKLNGDYPGEYGPISLIREYNGKYFISDKNQSHLPYSPYEHIFIVTDQDGTIYRKGDTITTDSTTTKDLYFSDGSISKLQKNSSLTLSDIDFKTPENNLTTKIKLFLSAGAIFTKATALNTDSDFEIYTSDTAAAVRGTVFAVIIDGADTRVPVLRGIVDVYRKQSTPTSLNEITETDTPSQTVTAGKCTKNGENLTDIECSDVKEQLEDFEKVYYQVNLPIGKNCRNDEDGNFVCDSGDTEPVEVPEELTCSFLVGQECLDDWDEVGNMPIYAYAPYNDSNKLYLIEEPYFNYGNQGIFQIDGNGNLSAKGIGGYLKYSGLDLDSDGDFAIEINIESSALQQEGGRYIFDNENNQGLFISKDNMGQYTLKYKGNKFCSDNLLLSLPECSLLFTNTFEKIIIDNKNSNLNIGGKDFSISQLSINDLYIGSTKFANGQLNGIIDHIKIYK